MAVFCKDHPDKEAEKFCRECLQYYCDDCFAEGFGHINCSTTKSQNMKIDELNEIRKSYRENPRFCPKCMEETTSQSIGNLTTVNGLGTTYKVVGDTCTVCNSTLVSKMLCIFNIPLIDIGSYRMIFINYTGTGGWSSSYRYGERFISRKMKE